MSLFPPLYSVWTGSHPSWSTLLHFLFFLVHSCAHVGVYQFSTVIYSRPARAQKKQTNHYAKDAKKLRLSAHSAQNSNTQHKKKPLSRHPCFGKHQHNGRFCHRHCHRPRPPPRPVRCVEPAHRIIGDVVFAWFDLIWSGGGGDLSEK